MTLRYSPEIPSSPGLQRGRGDAYPWGRNRNFGRKGGRREGPGFGRFAVSVWRKCVPLRTDLYLCVLLSTSGRAVGGRFMFYNKWVGEIWPRGVGAWPGGVPMVNVPSGGCSGLTPPR